MSSPAYENPGIPIFNIKPVESDSYGAGSHLEDHCFKDNMRSYAGGIEGLSGYLTQTTAPFYNKTGSKFC